MHYYPLCLQVSSTDKASSCQGNNLKGNPPTSFMTGTTQVDRNYQLLGSREFPLISDSSAEDESVFPVGNNSSQVMDGKECDVEAENNTAPAPPDVPVNTVQIENQDRTDNQTKVTTCTAERSIGSNLVKYDKSEANVTGRIAPATVQIENQGITENKAKETVKELGNITDVASPGKTAAKSARNTSAPLVTSESQP